MDVYPGTSAAATDATITFTNITTNNASTSKHGFLPKLNNSATSYLDGTGAWSTPAGASLSAPVIATYATNADLTTNIPSDDTIPQVGEGTQIISQAFTASNAAHRVRARFMGQASNASSADTLGAALFIDGAANAVKVTYVTTPAINYAIQIAFEYEAVLAAGAHTFTVRVGGNGTTMRMNGTSAARYGGGVSAATLVIEELNAP